MNDRALLKITRKEKEALNEFLKVLRRERDSIISFSLEGIVQGNSKKEELFKIIEHLENEKNRLTQSIGKENALFESETWKSLRVEIARIVKEIKTTLQNNIKLLLFSVDFTKSSMEHVLVFINNFKFDKNEEKKPVFLSKAI